jgi:hypothetical protein
MQKKLQFTAQIFLRTFLMYIIVQANIFCHLNLDMY